MPIVKRIKGKGDNGKEALVLSTDENVMTYVDKSTGEFKDKKAKTAMLRIAQEAGTLSRMEYGTVTVAVNDKNYFISETQKGSIVLTASDNEKEQILFERVRELDGGSFIKFDEKFGKNKDFIDKLPTEKVQGAKGNVTVLNVTVFLKNDKLQKELAKKENSYAVLSKDGYQIGEHGKSFDKKQEKKAYQRVVKEPTVQSEGVER
jgi:hypothetical protein